MTGKLHWPAAVILAGGHSTRMGREKALLDAGGSTLVERLAVVLAQRVERILISVASGGVSPELVVAAGRASMTIGRPVAFVPDLRASQGPLAGIEAALDEIDDPLAFFVAVDMPAVSFDLIGSLWNEVEEAAATGCMPRWSGGLEPACAFYSKCLLPRVRSLLDGGTRSLQALAGLPGVRVLDLEDPAVARRVFGPAPPALAGLFRNLNTPEDYAAWGDRPD